MGKLLKNLLCVFLSVMMMIAVIPVQAFAADNTGKTDENDKPAVIVNPDGEETNVADEWEQAYPYGVFAFGNYAAATKEGDGVLEVPVYRFGGTKGRVTAYVIYNPSIVQLTEDEIGYRSALSTDDVEIEAQDTSAIAQYQPIGKEPDPEPGDYTVKNIGKDGEYILSLSNDADKYSWQVKSDKDWEDVFDEDEKNLTLKKEEYDSFDFRCVYTKGEDSYCTASIKGEKYVKPEPEVLPEMPDSIDLTPASTYTKLEPDADDAYKAYVFPLTFADGEYVKFVRFTPLDDDISECPESASLIIQDCEGGCINKSFNSITVTVEDNDPAEPFELGITESEIKADKADGSVVVTVRRTGGYQEPVTIDYETVDGTAIAGKDYIADSDTLALAADITEINIHIQLLDDGIKTDKAKEFKVRLKDLYGDEEALCTLKNTEVTISLVNSGKAKKQNLATKLTDTDAIELTSSGELFSDGVVDTASDTVTGTQVFADEKDEAYAKIERGKTVKGMLKSYRYGDKLVFGQTGSGYWDPELLVIKSKYEFHGQSKTYSGENDNSVGLYIGYGHTAHLTVDRMAQYFSSVSANGVIWGVDDKYHYGWVALGNSGSVNSDDPNNYVSPERGLVDPNVETKKDYTYNRPLDFNSDINTFLAGEKFVKNPTYETSSASEIEVNNLTLHRRTFSADSDLYIAVHTANDGIGDGVGNVVTAPDGAASITTDSFYNSLVPSVSIASNDGGVNQNGALYVGSKLNIRLPSAGAFSDMNRKAATAAVYLTDSSGNIVKEAVKGDNDTYSLTLYWDGMTAEQLGGDYTINVIMDREQDLTLDFTPSVPRKADDQEAADLTRAAEAFDSFWDDGNADSKDTNYIEYGYSQETKSTPFFDKEAVDIRTITKDNITYNREAKASTFSPDVEANIQWVNFHRKPDDFIVINGRIYAGNEKIWLTLDDFNSKNLIFFYYSAEYSSIASKMVPAIDRIELYKDTNHNNKIDGVVDENGFFQLDKSSGDELLTTITDDNTFTESDLTYFKNEDGTFSQLYFKTYYSMNPRKLVATDEEKTERAQVMPALTTAVTEPEAYFALSDEQKNYRYLISGQRADGTYTSDDHIMYGAEATKLQYIDAPLGGDQSPAVSHVNEDGESYYTWEPNYQGNLLFPYDDPSPVYIDKTVVGEDYPIEDKDNINGYLGSLTEDTKMALCVIKQQKTVGDILSSGSSRTPGDYHRLDDADSTQPFGPVPAPDPRAWTDGESGALFDYSQATELGFGLNTTFSNKIPKFTFKLFGAVTFATKGNNFILGINVPVGSLNDDSINRSYTNTAAKQYDALAGLINQKSLNKAMEDKAATYLKDTGKTAFLGVSASASVGFVFEWKKVSGQKKLVFQRAAFALSISISGSATFRPFAFIYVCITVGVNFTFGTGYSRREYYTTDLLYPKEKSDEGTEVKQNSFLTDPNTSKEYYEVGYRQLNIKFKGKIDIQLYFDKECKKPVKKANRGFLQTDSVKEMQVPLMHGSGYKFADGSTYYLKIKALQDSTIYFVETITDKETSMLSDDGSVNIKPFITVVGGVGFGLINFQICFNFFYSMDMEVRHESEEIIKELKKGDLGFTVSCSFQLILFSFNMDIVTVTREYDYITKEWKKCEASIGDKSAVKAASTKRDGSMDYGSLLSLPEDNSDTQTVYRSQRGEGSSGLLKSYKPTDVSVPFELSGYYTSSNAAKLLDGVNYGYDYRVVTAENADREDVNYVIYHISRDSAESSIDRSMLVMSELVTTGNDMGLLNPCDPQSETPYIVVDADENAATGDMDFSADTVGIFDEDGNPAGKEIRVTWVSYDEPAKADATPSTQTLSDAAKNMVLKTAAYTPGSSAFTDCKIISNAGDGNAAGEKGECIQIPDISSYTVSDQDGKQTVNDAVAYVRSNHLTEDEINARTSLYEDYLRRSGYCVGEPTPGDLEEEGSHSTALALIAAKTGSWTTFGGSSDLCVKIGDSAVSSVPMEDGVTIDDVKLRKIGDKYYVVYTALEDCYTDFDGNTTTDKEEIANMLSIKRMYLRTCTLEKDGSDKEIVKWGMDGKAILLRTIYDYDNNEANPNLQDGIFANGEFSRKDNPYFDNIQFLSADLGTSLDSKGTSETLPLRKSASAEDFLLFDMCGSTYIIRRSSLEVMTGSAISTDENDLTTTTATIIPFFTPDISNTTDGGVTASSGRYHTTIGVDGDGNLAAVYVAGTANTNNNALCISKYDPNVGWGDKTVLAMNYLGVHERNLKEKRTDADSSKAFLGLLDGEEDGGLNEFRFRNIQVALGKESVITDGKVTKNPTLLILTQGSMQYLKENTDPNTNEMSPYIPVDDSEVLANPGRFERSADVPPGSGIYAVEFGSGTQAVGNASINMPVEDFSSGASTQLTVSFENTGDVPVRGSSDQPVSVELITSDKDSAPLAKWEITENIIPGQKVSLSGVAEIKQTLPAGTELHLRVSEDTYYEAQGGKPFSAITPSLFTVEAYTELAIRKYHDECIVEFDSVLEDDGQGGDDQDDGDTLIDLNFIADNRGTVKAEGVYAVFSYDTGKVDENGSAIYAPLDLSKSKIKISEPELNTGIQSKPKEGIVSIGTLDVDYYTYISGTLQVSPGCFKDEEANSLRLKIELFSNADKDLPEGTPDGVHNEYNSVNNIFTGPVAHRTVFKAPVNIEVPAGEELHIPVNCTYTMGEETPHILVSEFPDLEGNTHFRAHAFRYGVFENGAGKGSLELKAETEGSGYLRIKDISTNSFFDITYTVTPPASGENVYANNDIFEFYNANGERFDEKKADQTWLFQDQITAWGADNSTPYNEDLARGEAGSSFTFVTDAESVDIVFSGKARVELLKDDGKVDESFEPVTILAAGGTGDKEGEYASVNFGKNFKENWRTVRITVTEGVESSTTVKLYASFDRIIEHYTETGLPVPDNDENPPQIFFAQSFPQPGSIASKTSDGQTNSVAVDLFVLDETGVASVSVNGKFAPIKAKTDVRFWTAALEFSKNGTYTITAYDDLGNMASYQIDVNWFSDTAQAETYEVPTVSASLMKRSISGRNDVVLTDSVDFTVDDSAYILAYGSTSSGEGSPDFSASEISVSEKDGLVTLPVESSSEITFPTYSSGWYIVKATDPGSDGERWSVAVVEMLRLSHRQLIITADNRSKYEGASDPSLTYKTAGLWSGDEVTGSLAREEGEAAGAYAITQGTLSAPDDYHIIYKGAELTINHYYAEPEWDWQQKEWDEVTLDLSDGKNVSIHPDYYTVNDGEHIEKPAAFTRYVLTGTQNRNADTYSKVILHDGDSDPAAYNLCFDDLSINNNKSDDDKAFITVNGDNAGVNLLLRGDNDIVHYGSYIISSGASVSTVTNFRIGAEGVSMTELNTLRYGPLVSGDITFSTTGDVQLSGIDDLDQIHTEKMCGFETDSPSADPFIEQLAVTATFRCTQCDDVQTVTITPPRSRVISAGCESNEIWVYYPEVMFGNYLYPHEIQVERPGTALGHDYGEPEWTWNDKIDVIEIDTRRYNKISLHPDCYILNDGEPIKKNSKFTKYVFTKGSTTSSIYIHDGDSAQASYYICFSGMSIDKTAGSFVTVGGNNAAVNLSLKGKGFIECERASVFTTKSSSVSTKIRIASEDSSDTTFRAGDGNVIASENISFEQVGELRTDFVSGSLDSHLHSVERLNIRSDSDLGAHWQTAYGEEVIFDLSDGKKVDIHPDYYAINYGEHIEKDCSTTRYVFTRAPYDIYDSSAPSDGSCVNLHDGDSSEATYNIVFSDLFIYKPFTFLNIAGENASVNLSLCGNNTLRSVADPFFDSWKGQSVIRLAKEDSGTTKLSTGYHNSIVADNVTIQKVGVFLIDGDNQFDPDSFHIENHELTISGDPADTNPFGYPIMTADAAFTCRRCDRRETVQATVKDDLQSGVHHRTATVSFNGKTYTTKYGKERFTAHSLTLNGSIGVNFYVDLTDEEVERGSVVDFEWNVEGNKKTASVTLTADDKTANGYKATCPVAAAEMTYEISATLSVGGEEIVGDTYSAVEYADVILTDSSFANSYILSEQDKGNDGKQRLNDLRDLIKSMLSYGSKAQLRFDRNTGDLADKKLTAENSRSPYYYDPPTVTSDMIEPTADDMDANMIYFGLEYTGSTIVYLTETSMRHYYKIKSQPMFDRVKDKVTFNGEPVDYTVKGDEIYFELKNIPAAELDTPFAISFDGSEYKYSVLDYVGACLDSDKTGETAKALVAATYLYNQAADRYFI